jgi:PAP2 superfamily
MNTLVLEKPSWVGYRHVMALLAGFREHRILYGISVATVLAAYIEALVLGSTPNVKLIALFSAPTAMILLLCIIVSVAFETIRLNRRKFEGALLSALWSKLRDDNFAPHRVSNAVHSVICLSAFMSGFTAIKSSIPLANPFSWDPSFVALDKFLHFGSQPFEWMAPVLNFPIITSALNMNYNTWFFVMFGFYFWHGFARQDNRLRQHYLVAFMLTWFLGTCVFGTIFSSVGPGLYGRLYPDQADPYEALMTWLNHANQTYPIFALGIMDELWKSYAQGQGVISGISAMPSMHVGSSVLFVICAFATGKRWLIWATSLFCAAIFMGSIHLAWHYAADGYLGAAIALFSWWIAGKLVNWDRAARGVA